MESRLENLRYEFEPEDLKIYLSTPDHPFLNLENQQLTPDYLDILFDFFKKYDTTKKLMLGNNGLSEYKLELFFLRLNEVRHLEALSFSYLDSDYALFIFLKRNTTVNEITLKKDIDISKLDCFLSHLNKLKKYYFINI